jgi:uncharacterized LabA/DUF88 family protein
VAEERLKLAVFIDFDNIQIGVKDTLGKDFDVSIVLEALKERGEVVTKVAYGDWPRAGDQSRQMTQHAVHMVQRNVTPRGDKNGADINLALDALEMAFTRHHITGFAIVGGDSDFIALVEKLKQYDKQVFVVGGRAFTSNILQRNCTEFVAYENLLKGADGGRAARPGRRAEHAGRASLEARPLSEALANIQRALKILADRGVAPQLGLLKSTLLQLDSTFSERDYGAASFLEFVQKMEREGLVRLRRTDRGYLVEPADADGKASLPALEAAPESAEGAVAPPVQVESGTGENAMNLLRQAVSAAAEKAPNRPIYMRQVRQGIRALDKNFDERRHGFRGILDLLHEAQRQGLVKLQRDRKGVWRIFPILATVAAAVESTAPGAADAAVEPLPSVGVLQSDQTVAATEPRVPAEPTVLPEEYPVSVGDAAPNQAAPSHVPPSAAAVPVLEEALAQAPGDSGRAGRPRKARTPRSAPKSGKRKNPGRRNTKEAEAEEAEN